MLSKLPLFKRKEAAAIKNIKAMLIQCPESYVACSWGKQSIILTHMAYKIQKSIHVVFFSEPDSELITDFNNVKNIFLQQWAINYFDILNNTGDIRKHASVFMQKHKLTGVIMGLAACESKGRRITLSLANQDNIYKYSNGKFRCCPLRHWTEMDCASYIAKYNLPVLNIYKKFGFYSRTSAGVTLGTHAECGIDNLPSSVQAEIRYRRKNINAF